VVVVGGGGNFQFFQRLSCNHNVWMMEGRFRFVTQQKKISFIGVWEKSSKLLFELYTNYSIHSSWILLFDLSFMNTSHNEDEIDRYYI
jgi:hypothetical protein